MISSPRSLGICSSVSILRVEFLPFQARPRWRRWDRKALPRWPAWEVSAAETPTGFFGCGTLPCRSAQAATSRSIADADLFQASATRCRDAGEYPAQDRSSRLPERLSVQPALTANAAVARRFQNVVEHGQTASHAFLAAEPAVVLQRICGDRLVGLSMCLIQRIGLVQRPAFDHRPGRHAAHLQVAIAEDLHPPTFGLGTITIRA